MILSSPKYSLKVDGVKGFCPAGEVYAEQNIADKKTPVLSCEGALHSRRNSTSCS